MESALTYTQGQWDLVLASFVLAAFALIATFVYLISSRGDVSAATDPPETPARSSP